MDNSVSKKQNIRDEINLHIENTFIKLKAGVEIWMQKEFKGLPPEVHHSVVGEMYDLISQIERMNSSVVDLFINQIWNIVEPYSGT